jgi:hypothetical protein
MEAAAMPTLKSEPSRLLALAASLVLGAAVIGVLGGSLTATSAHAAEPAFSASGFGAGIVVRTTASTEANGLPVYPGATPRPDKGDDSAAATVGLWGGSMGFHLAVQKYSSEAALDDVAAYYRDAMGRYGAVLDCSQGRAAAEATTDKKALRCGKDDKADNGGRLYKVGTQNDQRIVSIKPAAGGVHFQLVHIETRGG